jgi:hypothetical protein
MRKLQKHLSFANVVSVIALMVALGGTAAAAGGLIDSADIKNKSIKNKDVKPETLQADRINESTLSGLDRCPGGAPTLTQGICFSGLNGGADWDLAARDCATKGLRLPDLGEGLLVTNKTTLPYVWTTDIADTSASPGPRVIVRTDDSGFSRIATVVKTNATPYVCVINATN